MFFSKSNNKKIFSFLLGLLMLLGSGTFFTSANNINENETEILDVSEYCNLNYEQCASSNMGKLFVHYKSGRFYFEDNAGTRWYSNPDLADIDTAASGVYRMELQSLLIIQYYDALAKQYKKANTETSCYRAGGSVKVTDINNGFEILYNFEQLGFEIPLRIVMDKYGIEASVNCEKIVEKKPDENMLYNIAVLPYFGAGDFNEEGYIMVADGSGAVMNFNNGKFTKLGYSSHVYGRDISKYLVSKPASNYPILMPVFGIKKSKSAICSIVTEGAAQSTFWCYPNKAITSYANAYAAFDLRETDIIVLSEDSNSASQSTLYQQGDITLKSISLSYRSILGETADYNGMAKCYKDYLVNRDSLKVKSQNMGLLSLDFYGAVKKKKTILGFPVKVNSPLSKFEDINSALLRIEEAGIEAVSVTVRDWSREQLGQKIDYSMNPVSVIGNKKDMISLIETVEKYGDGSSIYFEANLNTFQKSGKGYSLWFHSAKSLSNAPIYDYSYYVSNAYKNKSVGRTSYLIPSAIEKMANRVNERIKKYEGANVSLSDSSTTLYSDFNKKSPSNLENTRKRVMESAKVFDKSAFDSPADYVIKYTSIAQKLPTTSSRHDIFDYDIPFVQLVLSGIVPYTTEAANLSADIKISVLEAVATGSCLQFDLITENAYSIVGTERDELYSSSFEKYYEDIVAFGKHFEKINSLLCDCIMVGYDFDGNISKTTYSNGATVEVNRSEGSVKIINADKEYDFTV